MSPIENRAAWQIHRAAAEEAKARGACYACQQHAGFRAVEVAGLSELTLDLHQCNRPACQRAKEMST